MDFSRCSRCNTHFQTCHFFPAIVVSPSSKKKKENSRPLAAPPPLVLVCYARVRGGRVHACIPGPLVKFPTPLARARAADKSVLSYFHNSTNVRENVQYAPCIPCINSNTKVVCSVIGAKRGQELTNGTTCDISYTKLHL